MGQVCRPHVGASRQTGQSHDGSSPSMGSPHTGCVCRGPEFRGGDGIRPGQGGGSARSPVRGGRRCLLTWRCEWESGGFQFQESTQIPLSQRHQFPSCVPCSNNSHSEPPASTSVQTDSERRPDQIKFKRRGTGCAPREARTRLGGAQAGKLGVDRGSCTSLCGLTQFADLSWASVSLST